MHMVHGASDTVRRTQQYACNMPVDTFKQRSSVDAPITWGLAVVTFAVCDQRVRRDQERAVERVICYPGVTILHSKACFARAPCLPRQKLAYSRGQVTCLCLNGGKSRSFRYVSLIDASVALLRSQLPLLTFLSASLRASHGGRSIHAPDTGALAKELDCDYIRH
eukprot:GHUV01020118.1.p1 GENE.GHUV01020118.1~~GHUV01020118.1.p1  ORF type:complete len:165 (-),score=0.41 GHUV01020118.1:361-855(-)